MLPPITATAGCNYSSDGGYYSHDFDYGPGGEEALID
jgi:hypothetical protein